MTGIFAILLCVLASINTLASTRHGEAFTTVYSASGACIAFKDAYDVFPPEETWFDELTGTDKAVINKSRIVWLNLRTINDPWGKPYIYRYPGKHNAHFIDFYSHGADRVSKTEGDDPDDISNWYSFNRRDFYVEKSLATYLRPLMPGFIILTLFAYAFIRKRNFSVSNDRSLCWTRNLLVYYALSLMVCDASYTAFFLRSPTILFGLIPFVVSSIGLFIYRTKGERIFIWILLTLATLGIIFYLLVAPFIPHAK
jgi:hypothetical protein